MVFLRLVSLATLSLAGEPSLLGDDREGSLHCLGNCAQCHAVLDSMPRGRLEAAASHTDFSSAGAEDIQAWLAAPEVCDPTLMFPVDFRRQAWSLAAQPSPDYLGFRGATQESRRVVESCEALQLLSVLAWQGARRAAVSCRKSAESFEKCLTAGSKHMLDGLLRRWHAAGRRSSAESLAGGPVEMTIGNNDTWTLIQAFSGRAEAAMLEAGEKASSHGLLSTGAEGTESTARMLAELSTELGRAARLLMEHSRTTWGLKQLVLELSGVLPNVQQQLPMFRVPTRLYGRHWDMLERLLDGLEKQHEGGKTKLRMAELGVACGPIGLHLLHRFPQLQYYGADPTITDQVWTAYKPYSERAQLFATTSEEMHAQLAEDEPMDLVFIDGPHTYSNVRNDLHLWEKRVRPGGIVAGHDFTIRHPPLLWAVTEYRIQTEGAYINLGMDGVWWWQVQ
eukprot:TRINITY_DN94215_c0_g1_i1.p1 TRINITY_DN94215_c0_g1~~TRINITY_DN94215_c0_g1_i1.p1  ORF type:complete len:472 (-),score=102.32 TRINITY_DN94215_c0_g1_i1:5-1357(-)